MYSIKAVSKYDKGSVDIKNIEGEVNAERLLRGLIHEGFEVTISEKCDELNKGCCCEAPIAVDPGWNQR